MSLTDKKVRLTLVRSKTPQGFTDSLEEYLNKLIVEGNSIVSVQYHTIVLSSVQYEALVIYNPAEVLKEHMLDNLKAASERFAWNDE